MGSVWLRTGCSGQWRRLKAWMKVDGGESVRSWGLRKDRDDSGVREELTFTSSSTTMCDSSPMG